MGTTTNARSLRALDPRARALARRRVDERAVVVARAPAAVQRPKRRIEEEEDCPLFMDAMPRGGVCGNAALAGLAALVDEGEPKRRRIGEAQVGMALL